MFTATAVINKYVSIINPCNASKISRPNPLCVGAIEYVCYGC